MPVPEGHGSLSALHPVQDALHLTFRCHFAGSDGSVCKKLQKHQSAALMKDINKLTDREKGGRDSIREKPLAEHW